LKLPFKEIHLSILNRRSHHAFLFQKKKYVKEKKQLVQDFIPPLNIYIHMCTLYTYTNICMSRLSPSGFFGPSRCLIPTPGLTSEYLCSVCVCVRIHTLTHTYTPTRVKTRETALTCTVHTHGVGKTLIY